MQIRLAVSGQQSKHEPTTKPMEALLCRPTSSLNAFIWFRIDHLIHGKQSHTSLVN